MENQNKRIKAAGRILGYGAAWLIFLMPVARLLMMSLQVASGPRWGNYTTLLQEERTLSAIKNTIVIACGSTVIAVVLGGALAFLLAYTNVKRKKLMEVLILSQFVIPSYIITLSWSNLMQETGLANRCLTGMGLPAVNLYSIGGMVVVLGICKIPIVYMITLSSLKKIPRDLEWASRVAGYGQWETLWRVNLPQAMPALMGGGMLAFLGAIDNFSVPAFLGISSGIPVLSTYIYEKAISFGPQSFAYAAALAVMLSVIAIAGTLAQNSLVGRRSQMESILEDDSVRIELAASVRRRVEWAVIAFFGAIAVVPLISMVLSSFLKFYGIDFVLENLTMKNFAFVFSNRGVMQAVRTSLTLAFLTCLICIVAGTWIAYVKVRRKEQAAKAIELAASLTYAIPGIVLALAMIFHWSKVPNVYGTMRILMIAYVTRYLVLQIKGSTTALMGVHTELEEASAVSGSGKVRTWVRVIIPLIAKPVLGSSFFIMVSAMTELTLSSMLAAAGTKTIGLTIFSLQQAGNYNLSAAMSTMVVALIGAGYGMTVLAGRRKKQRPKKVKTRVPRALGSQWVGGEE